MKKNIDFTTVSSIEKSTEHENRFLSKSKISKASKNSEILRNSEQIGDKLK